MANFIEVKTQVYTCTVNIDNILYFQSYGADSSTIFLTSGVKLVVDHSYEQLSEIIRIATGKDITNGDKSGYEDGLTVA